MISTPPVSGKPGQAPSVVAVGVGALALGVVVLGATAAQAASFKDIPGNQPFASAINTLADRGVIGGYSDGTFRPTGVVTRQTYAAFLARELNLGSGTCAAGASAFSDVPDTSPFCAAIAGLAAKGAVGGYADGTFHPGAAVTRQAIAAFIYRADQVVKGGAGVDAAPGPTKFRDVAASNPFSGDINFLTANGIASGYTDGGFHPGAGTSRQAVASFLYKFGQHEGMIPADPTPNTCVAGPSDLHPASGGGITINVQGPASIPVSLTVHYKTTTSYFSGYTDATGKAAVGFSIGHPTKGYQVKVDVRAGAASCGTYFTPQ